MEKKIYYETKKVKCLNNWGRNSSAWKMMASFDLRSVSSAANEDSQFQESAKSNQLSFRVNERAQTLS